MRSYAAAMENKGRDSFRPVIEKRIVTNRLTIYNIHASKPVVLCN